MFKRLQSSSTDQQQIQMIGTFEIIYLQFGLVTLSAFRDSSKLEHIRKFQVSVIQRWLKETQRDSGDRWSCYCFRYQGNLVDCVYI